MLIHSYKIILSSMINESKMYKIQLKYKSLLIRAF